MLANLNLKVKLIGGFALVAAITAIVGGVGYWGVHKLAQSAEEIGIVRLPSVECLLKIKEGAQRIKAAQRTLLDPNLTAEVRANQFNHITKAREEYEAAWKVYEPLPQTEEEEAIWKEFVPAWQVWRNDNNEFFRRVKELESLHIGNPYQLKTQLEAVRSGHFERVQQSLQMITTNEVFDGGESDHECRLGKWMTQLNTENGELRAAVEAMEVPHKRFHQAVAKLKELVRANDTKEANACYQKEMVPARNIILEQLERIDRLADKALVLQAQLQKQAYEVCRASQTKANNLLDQLVKINTATAHETVLSGQQMADWAQFLALVASVGGVLIALGLGTLLALSILRPVDKVADALRRVAGGDYTVRVDIDSKDEIGQMAGALNTTVAAVAKAMDDVKEAAAREQKAQAERVEMERRQREEEQRRQAEEAEKERQRAAAEQKLKEEQAERERQQAAEEKRKADELRRKVDELLKVVNAAAQGDLTSRINIQGDEAIDELAAGIKKMLEDLSGVIGQVAESASQFNEGSRVIAESAQTLASGAQTQSSSVEEMTASIEELTRSIQGVKENAQEADQIARKANKLAEEGGTAVQKSIEAMELIRTSSTQISEIIQVISEIASQTNLLALNAAIEAARAGEHGMGFAVVADEVRKLAERSNQAAREISTLIKESTQRVEEGAQLSAETGKSLREIIEGVESTAAKIAEIATATIQQAANADEVSKAIQGVAQVTEQAAAGSEELASSSEELGAQASALQHIVSRFKTN